MGAYKAYLDNYSTAVTTYERLTRYQPFKKFIDVSVEKECPRSIQYNVCFVLPPPF